MKAMHSRTKRIIFGVSLALGMLAVPQNAMAYIGPGAGFAFASSFFVFAVSFILLFIYLAAIPFRIFYRTVLKRKPKLDGKYKRVIVLGFDGMDPRLTSRFMEEGALPNLRLLKERGSFSPLRTTMPAISPAAWSSFSTGVDPSFHNIFDFLTRDPVSYMPVLSSARINGSKRTLEIGKYRIPLGKPDIRFQRKSRSFWSVLGENAVPSSIIHVPISFPPEKFNGVMLSGMCTPDLAGSQGTYAYYTSNGEESEKLTGGECHRVEMRDGRVRTFLFGPENAFVRDGGSLKTPLTIRVDDDAKKARVRVCSTAFELAVGGCSTWVKVAFKTGLGISIRGICRFYLRQVSPHFQLYVSPINIDPEKPALPISHPYIYSIYLAKMLGSFSTLGLAEDTWALNEGILDENAFLEQTYRYFEEREKIFFKALERTPRGLCVCVFDATDRVQHMFYRYLDHRHPASAGNKPEHADAIKNVYARMDESLGRVMKEIGDETLVIVLSDHGFSSFARGVNLNTWLFKNGYLALKGAETVSGNWFSNVDWTRTRAFSLGLAGIFLNVKGRERQGTVDMGSAYQELKAELIAKLTGLVDEGRSETAIQRVADTAAEYSGPYQLDAPDLLVCYSEGYRNSWGCTTGRITQEVFEDNTKRWSGDHSIDPRLIPGIFFSNAKTHASDPRIIDIAPTVLDAFDVQIPRYMQGKSLLAEHDGEPARGKSRVPAAAFSAKEGKMAGSNMKIEKNLLERCRQYARTAGYSSVEEFVAHILENALRNDQTRLPELDENVAKQLKGLGYIE